METEIAKLKKFQDFLPAEDKLVFHDLLEQCKLYAPYASAMASPNREVPLLISMLFGQHKRIMQLEKKVVSFETVLKKTSLQAKLELRELEPTMQPVDQSC